MGCTKMYRSVSIAKTCINSILSLTLLVFLISCSAEPEFYKIEDFKHVEKIDAHVHINSMHPAFIQQSKADNFNLLSINIDTAEFPPLEEQVTISESLLKADPGHFAFASTFQMNGWDDADWQNRTIENVKHEVLTALSSGIPINGRVIPYMLKESAREMYSTFSTRAIDAYNSNEGMRQALIRPFGGFRLDCTVKFSQGCL